MLSSMGGQVNESHGVVAATKRLLLKHRDSTQNGPARDSERDGLITKVGFGVVI